MNKNRTLHFIIITVLVFVSFSNILPNNFGFDTPNLLIYNEAVHGFSLENLKLLFTSLPNGVEYLPVRDLTYSLDYELWKLNAFGYNLSNILYYLLACIMLYLFLEKLIQPWSISARNIAFLAVVLYIVHPVHVESVAGIAQRKDLVSGLFFFLSLRLFLDYREKGEKKYYLFSLVAIILSMLSKATAVILPLILLLINAAHGVPFRDKKKWLLDTVPFFVLSAVFTGLGIFIARGAGTVLDVNLPFGLRLLTAARAVFYYLKVLAIPYPLTIWHEFDWTEHSSDPVALLSLAGLAAFTTLLYTMRKTFPALFFFGFYYLVALIPVSGLMPTPTIVAERYLFLPSVGFAGSLAWLFWRSMQGNGKRYSIAAVTIVVLTCLSITITRNSEWRSNGSLYAAELRRHPDSVKINQTVARYHFINKRYDEAFRLFIRVKKLDKNNRDYEFHRAYLNYLNGDHAGALQELGKVLPLYDSVVDVHYLYGSIYSAAGDVRRARESFQTAMRCRDTIGIFFKSDVEAAVARLEQQ